MPLASLSVTTTPVSELDVDVLVLGVRKTEEGPELLVDEPWAVAVQESLGHIGVTGATDEVRRLAAPDGVAARSIALTGLGSADADTTALRLAAGSAARQLRGVESLAIALPVTGDDELLAVLEGAGIGAYAFTDYRVDSLAGTKLPASVITVVGSDDQTLAERAGIVAEALHTVRDLVNTPPSDLYPETLAERAVDLASAVGIETTVLTETELREGGYGGLLAVGSGSVRPPRLVKLAWNPAGATKHLALVGKGITFDTGGLTLKSPGGMVGMKYDMTGSATVLAVIVAAARLELPVRITAWMCIAENMPSGSATRPNDVLRIRGGKTVENLNSDAEGRLVLADGLVAAGEEEPDAIIDVATLTGAARVALGNRYVGLMGDPEFTAQVAAAGESVGENLWAMPFPSELRALLNSEVADIANVKPGNTAGGMLVAGVFLREFIASRGEGAERTTIPWAHLDIAGPANNEGGGWGYTASGPTGVTVRTLLSLAEGFGSSSV
ncbi:MAG: leucyl aminopeptidase [Aeromicrobium sp.]